MIKFPIYNAFGVAPTNTHVSAGMDFYIPNISADSIEQVKALTAFKKSYGLVDQELFEFNSLFSRYLDEEDYKANYANILHLYLAWNSFVKEQAIDEYGVEYSVKKFIKYNLVFDDKRTPGICVGLNDTLFINSGIKVCLPENSAGIYFNKSGMGNRGWDVRACVVDEDYSGFVHLSVAFTRDTMNDKKRTVYCGDKLTQMVAIPILHMQPEEVSEEAYNVLMDGTERGDSGFGSSDVKH